MLAKKTMGKSGLVWMSREQNERGESVETHTEDDSCLPSERDLKEGFGGIKLAQPRWA